MMVTSFKQYLAAFFQISNRSACLFSWKAGPKHADGHDPKGSSEGHEFVHKLFSIIGVPVLGAKAPGQLIFEGHAA
jgi:hypothetical protein